MDKKIIGGKKMIDLLLNSIILGIGFGTGLFLLWSTITLIVEVIVKIYLLWRKYRRDEC
jgi:hypothetical protein